MMGESNMTITERIATFVYEFDERDMPLEALEHAKSAVMDYVGVTLAGSSEKSVEIVRRLIETLGGHPQATVWGTGIKTSVTLAALANGTSAHALDYDDTNAAIMSHPSIQLLPGLFALGEYGHRSGREILLAYITGFEVGAKLGRALNPNMVTQGWFPVGTLGMLMQTVACAKLLSLDPNRVQMALGIATNLASGLRCNNGTMAKHLMAGHVGFNGVMAALLASEGMTANPKALEDRFGYFENFSRGDLSSLEKAVASLGKPLDILQSGISYKLYPCCAGTHMPIDATLDIVCHQALNPDRIETVEVSVGSTVKFLLIHPRPKTETEAKFSLEYCVARAILDSRMGPEQFTTAKIKDPAVSALIEKIKPFYYDGPSRAGLPPVEIQVKMKDGAVYSSGTDQAKGNPGKPLSFTELEEKFHQCCQGILPEARILRAKNQLREFESLADVAEFANLLG